MTGDTKFFLRNGVSRWGSAARVGQGQGICLGFMLCVSQPLKLSVSHRTTCSERFSTVVKHAESDLSNPCTVKIPGLWKGKGESNQYVNRGRVNHTFPGRLRQDQLCIHHSLHDLCAWMEIKDRSGGKTEPEGDKKTDVQQHMHKERHAKWWSLAEIPRQSSCPICYPVSTFGSGHSGLPSQELTLGASSRLTVSFQGVTALNNITATPWNTFQFINQFVTFQTWSHGYQLCETYRPITKPRGSLRCKLHCNYFA